MHGAVPDSFLYSTIVPIPEGRSVNRCDSSNYHGIALSSVYLKLIDNIVLQKFLLFFVLASYSLDLRVRVQQICVHLHLRKHWHTTVRITAQYFALSWMLLKHLIELTIANCSNY